MFGHRALDHDGWRAVCPWPGPSFIEAGAGFGQLALTEEKLRELDASGWELYHVAADAAETTNLAERRRDKLVEMIALWYAQAGKYDVFPIDSRGTMRFADERPQLSPPRSTYTYFPHTQGVPENVAVRLLNRAHSLTAEVEIPRGGAEGVVVCHGSNVGGYSLFVQDGKLHYVHNYVGAEEFHVESRDRVPEGPVELRYEFEPTGKPDLARGRGAPGRAQLYVNGALAGQAELPVTVPLALGVGAGLAVGRNPGSSVSRLYEPPFEFTGRIGKVTADVSGEMIQDTEEEARAFARAAMARQ
jgi:arylsulfatase